MLVIPHWQVKCGGSTQYSFNKMKHTCNVTQTCQIELIHQIETQLDARFLITDRGRSHKLALLKSQCRQVKYCWSTQFYLKVMQNACNDYVMSHRQVKYCRCIQADLNAMVISHRIAKYCGLTKFDLNLMQILITLHRQVILRRSKQFGLNFGGILMGHAWSAT